MSWKSFVNFIKKPFKLIANMSKGIYNKVLKPIANFGKNTVNSVGNFVKDSVNTVIHMPEKVIHSFDHTVDKVGDSLNSLFKSPVLIIGGIAAIMIAPMLMKK